MYVLRPTYLELEVRLAVMLDCCVTAGARSPYCVNSQPVSILTGSK
jgi:hypothetical protein